MEDALKIQLLKSIDEKLNKLIGIMAVQGKNKEEQIKILVSLGFTNIDISRITAIPKGTVDTIRARKKRGKR
jgi:hypothetical protein